MACRKRNCLVGKSGATRLAVSVSALVLLSTPFANAFTIQPRRATLLKTKASSALHPGLLPLTAWMPTHQRRLLDQLSARSHHRLATALSMYQLPPGRNDKGFGPLLVSVLTLIGTIAFFLSPIGALVISVVNSLILLSIAIPLASVAGFQIWSYFNTINAPCPRCGAPCQVYKQSSSFFGPSLCFNCGAVVEASPDNKSIDLVTGVENGVVDNSDWFGLFQSPTVRRTTISRTEQDAKGKRFRRERTIIDVDVDDEDAWM